MRYVYPCVIVRDEEEAETTGREAYVATFPDVPPAITGGLSLDEVHGRLQDCLEVALSIFIDNGEPLPEPSDPEPSQLLVSVSPAAAAKFALYTAMRDQGVSVADLGRRLGIRESKARRLFDRRHVSRPAEVERALKALGRHLVVEDQPSSSVPSPAVT
ncbi:type II toxin-antitoxin system HicB family antitoxin [Candidatus Poriferisodalis sp.]|uniref:type II toxin-antitoxin system HicB family antitoxin n=1 Tax=Candidatus Poriferisodalis sp. TaxID=3101277 RepID=UPI003B0143D6